MRRAALLKTGIMGAIVAAVCCFTPLLVIVLGAAGLSAALGYMDFVLLPSLALFLGITVYALLRKNC
jgi:mercuric ion transport protein